MGCSNIVQFVISPSVDFLINTNRSYDFIFLDGDHSASTVYQEIPRALGRLSPKGCILLHDYFPNLEPLWPEAKVTNSVNRPSVIPGVYLAIQRLLREGNAFRVWPFGKLPWKTKLGTNITSLAILTLDG